jgi:hypothetical protein
MITDTATVPAATIQRLRLPIASTLTCKAYLTLRR